MMMSSTVAPTAAGETLGREVWGNQASEASSFAAQREVEPLLDPEASLDAICLLSGGNDDMELLEQALRQGSQYNSSSSGSKIRTSTMGSRLKLRQGGLPDATNPLAAAAASGMERSPSLPVLGRKFGAGCWRRELVEGQPPTPAACAAATVAAAVAYKPRLVYTLFVIGLLTLVGISLLIVNDGLVMVEVASKVHTLAGLKKRRPEPDDDGKPQSEYKLRDISEQQWGVGGSGFGFDDNIKIQSHDAAEGLSSSSSSSPALSRADNAANDSASAAEAATAWNSIRFSAVETVDQHEIEHLAQQIEHPPQCLQGNATHWAQLFGLPAPDDDDVIYLTAGSVYRLQLISVDFTGQRRCAGGDHYETDLRSPLWRSRPVVKDLGEGSYEVRLQVHPRFAGKFVFKVVLSCSNFDGLKQSISNLSGRPAPRCSLQKLVVDLDVEFLPPPKARERPTPTTNLTRVPTSSAKFDSHPDSDPLSRSSSEGALLGLNDCKGVDFIGRRRWSGRWTRQKTALNPNCDIDSEDEGNVLECMKLQHSEGQCGAGDGATCDRGSAAAAAVGWVYSAHCSMRIFSREEAWQCLDGRWILWWSDDEDEQENAQVRDLLKTVLGLRLSEGPWDKSTGGPFSSNVYVRPNDNGGGSNASSEQNVVGNGSPKQRVHMSNMWNVDLERRVEDFQPVFDSYFTKLSSPDIVIMMPSGPLRDAPQRLWRNWTDFMEIGPRNTTGFWKETFESIPLDRRPRVVLTTTAAARHLTDFNVQLMEMHSRFLLEAYLRTNLTSDFRVVDSFDSAHSWMRRYDGVGNRQPLFVDLMMVHILLNAMCAV